MSDERDPFVLILGAPDRRARGRPRVDEPRDSNVTIWLRPSEHDRLLRLAAKHDLPLSVLLRSLLLRLG